MTAIAQQIHTLHAQEQPIHYKKSFDLWRNSHDVFLISS
jgi:hypothetical protein